MKKIFTLFCLTSLVFLGCKKSNTTNSPKCDWFPVYAGKRITYKRCVLENNTPSQVTCSTENTNGAVTDSSFRLGEMQFVLRNCDEGKIVFSRGSINKVLLIDNSKNSTLQVIYNDGNYSVSQYKDAAGFIYSTIKNIQTNYEIIRVKFIANTGFYFIDEVNGPSGTVTYSHTLQ